MGGHLSSARNLGGSASARAAGVERWKTRMGVLLWVVAAVTLAVPLLVWPPRTDALRHQSAGWGLAQGAVGLLGPSGEVHVITRDTTEFVQPALDQTLKGLRRALREKRIEVRRVWEIESDPLRLVEVPSGDFMRLVRLLPAGSVIVSLLGPPILSDEQRRQLGSLRTRVVAFCPGAIPAQVDLRRVYGQDLVDVSVVTRHLEAEPRGRSMRDVFEASFETLTKETVAQFYEAAPRAVVEGRD